MPTLKFGSGRRSSNRHQPLTSFLLRSSVWRLYKFIVVTEFRVDIVRKRFKSSVPVSVVGAVTPFLLGAGLGAVSSHGPVS